MKKSFRVKKEKDFQAIFQKRVSVANRNFVCYYLVKPSQKHFRVGISVGKKLSNLAVDRNAVKRKIRQSIFELKDEIVDEVDFVLVARPAAKDLGSKEVKKNIIHVLKLAGLIQGERNEK